ncbi:MAG: prephenate dehydratase [Alphaproteobacteria bacterium]
MTSQQPARSAGVIAFQGALGANSDVACRIVHPEMETLPCRSFEDAFAAVRTGRARLAMIPIENSIAGRVADVHHLMPESGLFIVGEHFQPIRHQLLANADASLETIRSVHTHVHALGQCRRRIAELKLDPVVAADTAGAAAELAAAPDPTRAVIATTLAAEIYGLQILERDIEDADHNTTRFLVLSRERGEHRADEAPSITTFVFQVRSVPAALYKALGGFATNGVNLTRLESYMLNGHFIATQFYADAEGHPDQPAMKRAFEELGFFTERFALLGAYPAHPYRYLDKE